MIVELRITNMCFMIYLVNVVGHPSTLWSIGLEFYLCNYCQNVIFDVGHGRRASYNQYVFNNVACECCGPSKKSLGIGIKIYL